MKRLTFGRAAVIDLAARSISFRAIDDADPARAAEACGAALVIAAGPLSGSGFPASSAVRVQAASGACTLTGHLAPALRRCGIDMAVVCGRAEAPVAVLLRDDGGDIIAADASAEVPALDAALRLEAKRREPVPYDSRVCVLCAGPAAALGCAAPAAALDGHTAPRSAAAAQAMAGAGLAGIAFCGALIHSSPLAGMELPEGVPAGPVTRSNVAAVLSAAREGFGGAAVEPGRSVACFACPAPCGFRIMAGGAHVACTSPEGIAVLLEAGMPQERAASVLALAARWGVEPACLAGLGREGDLPASAAALAGLAVPDGRAPLADDGLGVCPLFLKRFPAARAAAEAVLAQAADGKGGTDV